MILAKPVINKQYWILKQDNQKIGNIEASADGYRITIKNKTTSYKTIPALRKKENVEFDDPVKASKPNTHQVHGYETGCRAYNGMWDIKRKLPLFTKEEKSKSWFAAGWYLVKQHRNFKAVNNPKLIVLDRYEYQGPFYTKEEANDKSVS